MTIGTLLYTIVDAFTSTSFSGNPASVIILPPQYHTLPSTTLLQIAAEFNLSEAAFLIPAASPNAKTLRYGLRWFTPEIEVPLCGHATLASARVVFSTPEAQEVDTIIFDTLSGQLVAKKLPGGKIELDFPASQLNHVRPESGRADDLTRISEVVGLAAKGGVSVRAVVEADFFLLLELDPTFDLENAAIDPTPFKSLPFKATILTTSRPSTIRPSARFMSRVFAPNSGVPEDPVTGSAHCVLAPYWSQVLDIPAGEVIETRQASKRGGNLDLILDKDTGRVKIRGSAVVTMRGELYL